MKALFLHNKQDLSVNIEGGVQLCTQEYLQVIQEIADKVVLFEVKPAITIAYKALRRLNLENYSAYQPSHYRSQIQELIIQEKISHVFMNQCALIRFSKIIKEIKEVPPPKVIILSHGNESGDLLGDLSSDMPRYKRLLKWAGIFRLGLHLYTESWYRRRFIDLVCTMSKEEESIEKWLGINRPFLFNRIIQQNPAPDRNPHPNCFGYVGTLDHSPNINAIKQICACLSKVSGKFTLHIVGQPSHIGKKLENTYPFIKYKGALSNHDLRKEVSQWAYFINPIFYYSRGASMKLSKAIEWEIPVISTIAGKRGYSWREGQLIETLDTPADFVKTMVDCMQQRIPYHEIELDVQRVKHSSISLLAVANDLKQSLGELS